MIHAIAGSAILLLVTIGLLWSNGQTVPEFYASNENLLLHTCTRLFRHNIIISIVWPNWGGDDLATDWAGCFWCY